MARLIQAWVGHKSFRRRDDSDGGDPPENWHKKQRSNEAHQSRTDPQAKLYRKSQRTAAILCYQGHVLTDDRHGLVVDVQASQANGTAERETAIDMLARVADAKRRITMGADKAHDTREFVKSCREHRVTAHVSQHFNRHGGSAIDARTKRYAGYGGLQPDEVANADGDSLPSRGRIRALTADIG